MKRNLDITNVLRKKKQFLYNYLFSVKKQNVCLSDFLLQKKRWHRNFIYFRKVVRFPRVRFQCLFVSKIFHVNL